MFLLGADVTQAARMPHESKPVSPNLTAQYITWLTAASLTGWLTLTAISQDFTSNKHVSRKQTLAQKETDGTQSAVMTAN